MYLFYCNTLECVKYLLGNPLFSNHIDFCPIQLYWDAEEMIQIYTEWVTGDAAWDMHVSTFFSPSQKGGPDKDCSQPFQMVQLSLELPSRQTKRTFQS